MKTKKLLAFLLASAMMCTAFTACGDKEDSSKEESSAAETTAEESSEEETSAADESSVAGEQVQTGSFEEPVAAQYWGTDEDLLTYDAGVVPITGDGEYTVSVNGATAGLMYDVTGDANGDYTPSGMSFMAVMVKDGTTLYPNMAIEITSIKMNGEEVPMTKKNYTSSDDGVEMRTNIYNEWVNELPEDAHDANGAVTDASAYSAQIVDKDAFNSGWTSVEVTFNVTGTGK